MKKFTHSANTRPKSGFALIAVLSLVALLGLIAVGLLTLSAMSMRQQKNQQAAEQAKTNAKLGLMEAIGQLQSTMGPDMRVSATAQVVATSPQLVATPLVTPNTLGVWNSWSPGNVPGAAMDYNAAKTVPANNINPVTGGFIKWLTSTNAPAIFALPTIAPAAPAEILGADTISLATDHVNADTISVGTTGAYAWHVFDESQKANITLNNPINAHDLSKITSLNQTGKPGFDQVAKYSALGAIDSETASKVINIDSIPLGSPGFDLAATDSYSAMTNLSKSLLIDVTQGQFQTDLSLLFAANTLPAGYMGRHLYSDANAPIAADPERFDGTDNSDYVLPLPNPDPTWDLLHSHYRLYRDVQNIEGEYHIPLGNTTTNELQDGPVTPIFDYGSGYNMLDRPKKEVNQGFDNNQQILPVISNAQFIYSLTNTYDPNKEDIDKRCNAQMITDVIVTLWNPYNVNINFDNMELEFYRFPARFAFYRNSVNVSPGDYFHVASMHHPGNIAGVSQNAPWTLRDSVPYRVRIQGTQLAPGEFRVFGVNNYNDNLYNGLPIANHRANNFSHGMVLENNFNETQGGVMTSAIMWKDNRSPGQEHGWLYGRLGDTVSVSAQSGMVTNGYGGFNDLNGEDAAAYIKIYIGDGGDLDEIRENNFDSAISELHRNSENGGRIPIGSIVLNPDNLNVVMPDISESDTADHPLGNHGRWLGMYRAKTPMVIASLRLKTEQSSNDIGADLNSRTWINNGITNPYSQNGVTGDQDEDQQNLQYELTWEPMTDWSSIPAVEIDDGRGYGGSGISSETGVNQAVIAQVPLTPATSIAQLSHAPINKSGLAPLSSQIIGNSFASPTIDKQEKLEPNPDLNTSYLDHSYLANNTLFDGYFLSTAYDETDLPFAINGAEQLSTKLTNFFTAGQPLHNNNFEPITTLDPGLNAASYADFSSYLYNKGAFNVNSTSIDAWVLFLSSGSQAALPILNALDADIQFTSSDNAEDLLVAFPRFSPMLGDQYGNANRANDDDRWRGGVVRLTQPQILALATSIVAEVQARGPFQSVAEFVNRRLTNTPEGDFGALQAAINTSLINNNGWHIDAPVNEGELGGQSTGSTSDGAPDHLTQADILNRIAPSLTVRGDTFKIRSYGDSRDAAGNISSKVWCEAVLQRTHDYVDSADISTIPFAALTSATNQVHGRKFKIVSFRWLTEDEI